MVLIELKLQTVSSEVAQMSVHFFYNFQSCMVHVLARDLIECIHRKWGSPSLDLCFPIHFLLSVVAPHCLMILQARKT